MRRKDREITDIGGIEEILQKCMTCHVAMSDDGEPYVVPLNFGYSILDRCVLELYFHSALEGKKLDVLKRNSRVCFAVTHEGEPIRSENPCNSGYYFSSVIGFGNAVFIDSPNERCDALSVLHMHQTGKDVKFTPEQARSVCVFKIVSSDFTGKKKPKPI